ncbi:uncharacterized protein ACN2A1_014835 isoform 2-T2 [Glossina fuscipes fuscipes]
MFVATLGQATFYVHAQKFIKGLMLKHTSTAGGPANGQVRNNGTTTARNIHLRPPQPLNISTLSQSNQMQNNSSGAPHNNNTANGGPRITTLLNISPNTGGATVSTATGVVTATAASSANGAIPPPVPGNGTNNGNTTNTTPITQIHGPLTPNGLSTIGNNLHTYTNQHILAHAATAAAVSNANTNTNGTVIGNHNNNNTTTVSNANNHQNNYTNCTNPAGSLINQSKHGPGPREALTSLGLLCLVSLLLALLSLIFLLKISPNAREDALTRSSPEDFVIVYDVTLALCALSLSLNLCCLLVCAIQFLFAVKLVRSPMFDGRDNRYLEKSSTSRTCAVGGFFISIPIFLTGIILYTFNHFHSTPAIITSVLIGLGIVFCGAAMVHNVFVWQKEKTISYRTPSLHHHHPSHHMSLISQIGPITPPAPFLSHPLSPSHLNFNHSNASILLQPTPVTPVSPNHSHGSFNPLTTLSSSFLMRPATATPPTPKPISNGCLSTLGGGGVVARETSGSVSPGLPPTLDMSNVAASTSLHELSTLV